MSSPLNPLLTGDKLTMPQRQSVHVELLCTTRALSPHRPIEPANRATKLSCDRSIKGTHT